MTRPTRELSPTAKRIHAHLFQKAAWLSAAEVAQSLMMETDTVEREMIFLSDAGRVTMKHGVPRQYKAS